jgi:hypothetical protein
MYNRAVVSAARAGSRTFSSTSMKNDSMSILRSWGPVGKWLRDQKNLVPETQKQFHAKNGTFTFLKKDSDRLLLGISGGALLIGTILMGRGKSAKE